MPREYMTISYYWNVDIYKDAFHKNIQLGNEYQYIINKCLLNIWKKKKKKETKKKKITVCNYSTATMWTQQNLCCDMFSGI